MSERIDSPTGTRAGNPSIGRRSSVVAAIGGLVAAGAATAAGGRAPAAPSLPRLPEWGPKAPVWSKVPVREVALTTAPRFHAAILGTAAHDRLQVQAIGTAEEVYIRVQWEDERKDDQILNLTDFSDAVAIQFPRNRDPQTSAIMGTRDAPVNVWYWRASAGKAENLVAEGPFTIVPAPVQDVEAVGQYEKGQWVVTFRRRRPPSDHQSVDLAGVTVIPAAFALWEGENHEANGLKAVTVEAAQGQWIELTFSEMSEAG